MPLSKDPFHTTKQNTLVIHQSTTMDVMTGVDFITLKTTQGIPGWLGQLSIRLLVSSQGDETQPHIGLCAKWGVCLSFFLLLQNKYIFSNHTQNYLLPN